MWFTAAAVAAGALIGVLLGGRPRHLPEHAFHLWPLLLAGLALQVASELGVAARFGFPMVVASYALLLTFAALNFRLTGMGVVMVGIVLNVLPIVVNHGMPVRTSALVRAGVIRTADNAVTIRLRGQRHIVRPSDRLTELGDIVPVRPFHQVVSFGDLVLAIGTVALVVNLLKPPRKQVWRAH